MIYKLFSFVIFTVVFFSSCKDKGQLTTLVQNMREKEVKFPSSVTLFQAEVDTLTVWKPHKVRIVIYFSEEMCTVCNIEKIVDWDGIKRRFKNWDVIFILSFSEEDEQELLSALHINNVNDAIICLDKGSMFKNMNPFIADNPLLHVFLLDSLNRIKIIGDPLYNEKVLNLYDSYYQQYSECISF